MGRPTSSPQARLASIRAAGEQHVPFTSGILIGIGETRQERIDSLLALRDLHGAHGHIQEIIIQNFRPKAGTRMADAPAPSLDELLWTIAIARLLFAPSMNIQAPPNLSPGELHRLLDAGINDWGGVSPVTPDHVNPEAPWPHLKMLERATNAAGKQLVERLAIYPAYARRAESWVDPAYASAAAANASMPTDGRAPMNGRPGSWARCPMQAAPPTSPSALAGDVSSILTKGSCRPRSRRGRDRPPFRARGNEFAAVCNAADELRHAINGDVVSYVVTRNINYTNICYFKCQFCAFSKGKMSENLRGRPYDLPHRRSRGACARRGREAPLKSACRAAFTRATPATNISTSATL